MHAEAEVFVVYKIILQAVSVLQDILVTALRDALELLNQVQKNQLILATHRHAGKMQFVTMASVDVHQNIKEIPIESADLNVSLVLNVRQIKHA